MVVVFYSILVFLVLIAWLALGVLAYRQLEREFFEELESIPERWLRILFIAFAPVMLLVFDRHLFLAKGCDEPPESNL